MVAVSDLELEKVTRKLRRKSASAKFFRNLPTQLRTLASHATLLNKISTLDLLTKDLQREIDLGGDFDSWKGSLTKDRVESLVRSRLETIHRTNIQTVYNQGAFERAQELKDDFPYMIYDAIDDSRTRPSHAALDGIIRRVDDPFWQTHLPPNDFNCRCGFSSLTKSQAMKIRKDQGRKGVQSTSAELKRIKKGTKKSLSGIPSVDSKGKAVAGGPSKAFQKKRKEISETLLNDTRKRINMLPKKLRKPFLDKLDGVENKSERWYTRNSDKFSS